MNCILYRQLKRHIEGVEYSSRVAIGQTKIRNSAWSTTWRKDRQQVKYQ